MATILKAGFLIDGKGGEPLADPTIVIRSGRIAELRFSREGVSEDEAGSVVIDAAGKSVLPGLIDSHAHLAPPARLPTGQRSEREPDETLVLKAVANAQAALCAGVTTIRDLGSRGFTVLCLRDAVNSGMLPGPRLRVSGPVITTTTGHGWRMGGLEADSVVELRKAVRALVKMGVDCIKVMASGGRNTPGSNMRAPQYTAEELRAVVEDAHRLGRSTATHALSTEAIKNAVQAGVDTIAHCAWLGRDEGTIDFDETVVEDMARKGLCADINISAALRPLAESDGRCTEFDEPAPRDRWDFVKRMSEMGVRVILSTDATGGPESVKDFPAQLVRLVERGGISPLEVIRMATKEPADVFGLGAEIGAVEVGKAADLLIVDGNPAEDVTALTRPCMVFRDGELVASAGQLVISRG